MLGRAVALRAVGRADDEAAAWSALLHDYPARCTLHGRGFALPKPGQAVTMGSRRQSRRLAPVAAASLASVASCRKAR